MEMMIIDCIIININRKYLKLKCKKKLNQIKLNEWMIEKMMTQQNSIWFNSIRLFYLFIYQMKEYQ